MCGISGIIDKNSNSIIKNELDTMNDIIAHRGPDSSGYYYGTNFALGHRRLAVIDLSSDGSQPMHYRETYTIVFNGEIYNYLELKEQLTGEGYTFQTHTDTEVIMASYDKWGEECVSHFNGMWAFALYNKKKNEIFCSRDRFGVKPFYYANLTDQFIFGSEIKQLLINQKIKAKLNRKRALDYLLYNVLDHTVETFFEGIFQLRGGHNLVYNLDNHSYVIYQWYHLPQAKVNLKMDFHTAVDKFEELFENSVSLRLRSDVKVGSCLSGGLDSSSIVCVANDILRSKHDSGKQETVSSCFNDKKYDEQKFIDEVAQKTGVVSHKVYPRFEDLFEELDRIIWHQDEPFGSTSIFAQWNVFKTAKEHNITVMLDGQGADEQLAGYHPFYGPFFAELLRQRKIRDFFREIRFFKRVHGYSNKVVAEYLANSFLPRKIRKHISRLVKNDKFKWLSFEINKNAIRDFGVYKNIRDLSIEQLFHTSVPMLLHYEDRNSMADSIEARVPFLDYRLVEFIVGLPDDFKIKNGKTKYILREALKDILPDKIINRFDKMGFVTPEKIWIKENAALFRAEIQKACANLFPLVNQNLVLDWFDNRYLKKDCNGDYTIWRLICLGRWVKLFNVSI